MANYRRVKIKGGTYFFTVVTYNRQPIFRNRIAIEQLRTCFQNVMKKYPYKIDAIVILPDHLHTLWTLPENDSDFSVRWKLIKSSFSRFNSGIGTLPISGSLFKKNEKGVWQRRFWEHAIRDQNDYNQHCDYIHYNPVKHNLAKTPGDWAYSSFGEFVKKGLYDRNWGLNVREKVKSMNLE